MISRFVSLARREPWALLAAAVLLSALTLVLSLSAVDALDPDGLPASGTESEKAESLLELESDAEPAPGLTVATISELPISSPAARLALRTVSERIKSLEGVAAVRPGSTSADGRGQVLGVLFETGADPDQRRDALETIRSGLDPGPLELSVGGPLATEVGAREQVEDELLRAGALALPPLLLLLIAAYGLRGLGPIVLAGILGVGVAGGLVGAYALVFDPTLVAIGAGALVGGLSALETTVVAIGRERADLAVLDRDDALKIALGLAAAPAVAFAWGVAAILGAATIFIDVPDLRSAVIGAALGALAGPLAAIVAVVATAGPLARRGVSRADEGPRRSLIDRVARLFERRAVGVLALVALAATVPFALAVLGSDLVRYGPAELPIESDARTAEGRATDVAGLGVTTPGYVAIADADAGDAAALRGELESVEGVGRVSRPFTTDSASGLRLRIDARTGSLAAQRTVSEAREALSEEGSDAAVGGDAAEVLDAGDELGLQGGAVAGLAMLVLGLSALLICRTWVVPALVALCAVPAVVAVGAVELVFSTGGLSSLLDYRPVDAPHLAAVIAVGAVVLAISILRGLESVRALASELEIVSEPAHTARAVIAATLPGMGITTGVGVILGLALLVVDWTPLRELGFGLACGLLADLVLIRVLATPALIASISPSGAGSRGAAADG